MTTTTHYIEVNKGYAVIRLDVVAEDTLITVYNVNVKDIDVLIEKLQALKAEYIPKPKQTDEELIKAVFGDDEPAEMTAVLGPKPDPTAWYKNALQKNAAQPVEISKPQPPIIREPAPNMPLPKRGKNIININGVATKQHKHYGVKISPNMNADIIKGESIRIYGISESLNRWDGLNKRSIHYQVAYDRTFKIGDTVEYDSYNFAYTGKIVAIGEKTVKIEHEYGGKVTQLDLHTFIYRNWDLDLKKIADDYQNWSMTS